ncbi:MAG: hypothetical protein COA78_23690 [Blastopirellula sp.]|nr:MAG: hypothetical protein COA78_23690 [Blastopirellula sp.]
MGHNQQQNCQRKNRGNNSNSLGLAGFFVSLFGLIFTCGLLSPIGLVLSIWAAMYSPKGTAIAGVVIGSIGTILLAVCIGTFAMAANSAHYYSHEVPMQQATYDQLHEAIVTIKQHESEQGKLPGGIAGNRLVLETHDAWDQSVRYELEDNGNYAVRSGGPDQTFDTEDDLLVMAQ